MVQAPPSLTEPERQFATTVAARSILPVEGVQVQAEVARIFAVSAADIVGDRRTAKLVDARSVIACVLTERGWTETQVGELINRSPSTTHHLLERIQKDSELRFLVKQLAA